MRRTLAPERGAYLKDWAKALTPNELVKELVDFTCRGNWEETEILETEVLGRLGAVVTTADAGGFW